MASLSPGPSLLVRGARLICRRDLALPHESHWTVVIPFTRTPSACWTRCSMAAGPGWPSRLCQSSAVAFCGDRFVRELFVCVWYVASGSTLCSITHWPCISLRFPIITPSWYLSVVGFSFVSHQIPICLSSRKETRLQCRSGQMATSCSTSLVSPDRHLMIRSMLPYPLIHIFVLPAHIKSPYEGGRKLRMRSGLFVIWHVEPESRMNENLSG